MEYSCIEVFATKAEAEARVHVLKTNGFPNARFVALKELVVWDRRKNPATESKWSAATGEIFVVQHEG